MSSSTALLNQNPKKKIVGGSEIVSAQNFDGYNYVALGHLHRSQRVLKKNICYSGSPLKYSFDEIDHEKSVTLVEIDSFGRIETQRILLSPRHDLIALRKSFEELIKQPTNLDYASITLTDMDFIYDVEEKLRKTFPNLLEVKRDHPLKILGDTITKNFQRDSSIFEQFANFFEQITHSSMTKEESETFKKFLQELEYEELKMK